MTTLATQSPVDEAIFGEKSAVKGTPSTAAAGRGVGVVGLMREGGMQKAALGVQKGTSGVQKTALAVQKVAAIDAIPVAGPSLTLEIGIAPANIVLCTAPVTVAIVMLAAWVMLKSVGFPLYMNEMFAAAIVSAVGGMFASIPLYVLMRKGAQMIAKAGILSIAVRCSLVLFGMILAMQPAWGLAKMPFVYWVLAYYFPILMVETALVAWLSVKAKF